MVYCQVSFYHLALSVPRQPPDYLPKVIPKLAEQRLLAVLGDPNDVVFAFPSGVV